MLWKKRIIKNSLWDEHERTKTPTVYVCSSSFGIVKSRAYTKRWITGNRPNKKERARETAKLVRSRHSKSSFSFYTWQYDASISIFNWMWCNKYAQFILPEHKTHVKHTTHLHLHHQIHSLRATIFPQLARVCARNKRFIIIMSAIKMKF